MSRLINLLMEKFSKSPHKEIEQLGDRISKLRSELAQSAIDAAGSCSILNYLESRADETASHRSECESCDLNMKHDMDQGYSTQKEDAKRWRRLMDELQEAIEQVREDSYG